MSDRPVVVELPDPIIVEALRRKTPQERLAQVDAFWIFARDLVRSAVRQQHPDYDEAAVRREAARRLSHGASEIARD